MATTPHYSEKLLIRIIYDCVSLEDLVLLGQLYTQLEDQGDIKITRKILYHTKIKQYELVYSGEK